MFRCPNLSGHKDIPTYRHTDMIAHLTGNLKGVGEDSIILDVNGVGYEIFVALPSLEKLKNQEGTLSLLIQTIVREESITLFGFLTPQEKQIFLRLLSVSGIGPKVALNILSGISSESLIKAIHREDLGRLTSIPGIGKKTAERLIVELKDKLFALLGTSAEQIEKSLNKSISPDLLSALTNLGYNRFEIEKKLEKMNWNESLNFQQKLKESLQILSK